jgi:hypothetical protein
MRCQSAYRVLSLVTIQGIDQEESYSSKKQPQNYHCVALGMYQLMEVGGWGYEDYVQCWSGNIIQGFKNDGFCDKNKMSKRKKQNLDKHSKEQKE